MKSYTIKITAETKQTCSPRDILSIKDHIDEIAQARDDGKAIVEAEDLRNAAALALQRYHGSDSIYSVEVLTGECYCDLDRYVPTIMADCMVTYWMDSKYRIAKLSALGVEAYWNCATIHAYVQDYVEDGNDCI